MRRSILPRSALLACMIFVFGRHAGAQTFDVLHYALDARLAMVDENFRGHVTVTLRLLTPTDSLTMNQAKLTFDTLLVDGVARAFRADDALESFTIRLGATRNPGDTLRVDIWYRRVVGLSRPGGRWGYYFFLDTLKGTDANLGYTMGEPSDARFWFPCFDDPRDKATAEINATVPAGYVAASNGKLLGRTTNPDATETWRWREDHPITTYLMCITASKFSVVTQPFARASGDTIPVQYYVWKSDSAAAAAYLPTVCEMIRAYGRVFGPYPFDKYGMSAVTPFGYGGMEHQSMTTLHRSIAFDDGVVCHELAHQWWGDLVTCADWRDIWLNESFASYSEALWAESRGGRAALLAYMKNNMQRFYAGSWFGSIYDPEGQGFPLFSQSVYSKGAWVLHMLRGVVGDSAFFKGLAAYRGKFSGGVATTGDFRASVESASGKNLGWFFNEWIYSPGWPVYSFKSAKSGDTLSVTVQQRQGEQLGRAFPTLFKMPLPFHAYYGAKDTLLVAWDSLQTQTSKFALTFTPDSVKLDPEGWVLMERAGFTSVAEGTMPAAFRLDQNYPNPFNPNTTIRYAIPVRAFVKLSVYDVIGREVAQLVNGEQESGSSEIRFDGAALASGVYFARLQSGGSTSTVKMLLMK